MKKKTFIICVELSTPSQATQVNTAISTFIAEKYIKIMDNVFIVAAREHIASCEHIKNILSTALRDCQIFVMQTSPNASWRLDSQTDSELVKIF